MQSLGEDIGQLILGINIMNFRGFLKNFLTNEVIIYFPMLGVSVENWISKQPMKSQKCCRTMTKVDKEETRSQVVSVAVPV